MPMGNVSHTVICNFVSTALMHTQNDLLSGRMKYPKFTEEVVSCSDSVVTLDLCVEEYSSLSQQTYDSPVTCSVISGDHVACESVAASPIDDIHKLWGIKNGALADSTLSVEDKKVLDLWDRTCELVGGHYILPIP